MSPVRVPLAALALLVCLLAAGTPSAHAQAPDTPPDEPVVEQPEDTSDETPAPDEPEDPVTDEEAPAPPPELPPQPSPPADEDAECGCGAEAPTPSEGPAATVPPGPVEPVPGGVAPEPPPPALAPASAALLPRSLGSRFEQRFLVDLPGEGLWSLFETVEPTAILDRMDTGGLYVGEAGLLGVRGTSWTRTTWTMDGLDITDPDRTGTPLYFAHPDQLEAVEIAAGLSPAEQRGIGPDIHLVLRRPGRGWRRNLRMTHAPGAAQHDQDTGIARLHSFASARLQVEGPLGDRLAFFATASMARGARRERDDPRLLKGREDSLLAHLVHDRSPRDEFRFVAGFQGVAHPYAGRARFGGAEARQAARFFQLQSTWQRRGRRPFTLNAGFVGGAFDPELPALAQGIIERTRDGPVQLLFPGKSARHRLAVAGHWDPHASARHALRVGGSLASVGSTTRPAGAPGFVTAETVAGLPARVWDYGWAGPRASWSGIDFSLFATDQVRRGRLTFDAGLRYDLSRGSAIGSPHSIKWQGLSSRVVARVSPFGGPGLVLLAGHALYQARLPLNLLAYGDPAAPQGEVYRWRDDDADGVFAPAERGELIARVGPGGPLSAIDWNLRPPRARDVFVGLEGQAGAWQVRFLAYHRRERDLVASFNVGAPASAYDVYYVPDPGNDIDGTTRLQMLPIYNRRVDTFGQDRYRLANDAEKGHGKGLELLIERNVGRRFRLLVGGTASKSIAPAAWRGFEARENDLGLVGENREQPNAATLSKGRLFFERGYNLKIAATYAFPGDVRAGAVARYQDGQHFARLVIPEDLNQGPDPVRGIANGESRFTFVLTFDARVEKAFTLGSRRLTAALEAFNITDSSIEVEQDVIWRPGYRATSAVQPPRTFRLSLDMGF